MTLLPITVTSYQNFMGSAKLESSYKARQIQSCIKETVNACFFETLPVELHHLIASKMEAESLAQWSLTCKILYKNLSGQDLWKNIYKNTWKESIPDSCLHWRHTFFHRVKAESRWKNHQFKQIHSQSHIQPGQGLKFHAVSNSSHLLLNSVSKAQFISTNRFPVVDLEVYADNAHTTLNSTACTESHALLGWSSKGIDSISLDIDKWDIKHAYISEEPNAIAVSNQFFVLGTQQGSLYYAENNLRNIYSKNYLLSPIGQIGFVFKSPEYHNFIYIQDQRQNTYFIDLLQEIILGSYYNMGITQIVAGDSPNFFMGTQNKGLLLKDVSSPSEPAVIFHTNSSITCMLYNNNKLAAGTSDGDAFLWDLRKPQEPLAAIKSQSPALCIQTDGEKLISGFYDGTVKLSENPDPNKACDIIASKGFAATSLEMYRFNIFATFANGSVVKLTAP